jgi:DNA-binding IclR family transcriptional regulator
MVFEYSDLRSEKPECQVAQNTMGSDGQPNRLDDQSDAARRMGLSPPTDRVVAVLEYLAAHPRGASASATARALELNGSTCAVLLASLERARWVERAPDKTYRLGAGLLSIVDAMRARFPLLGAGDTALRRLAEELGCTCVLTRIHSDHLLVVAAAGGGDLAGSRADRRFPIDPPYGSGAMAWRAPDEIERWLDLPAKPLTRSERARYRRFLAGIRARGYAVWRLDEGDGALVGRVREMLDALRGDPHSEALRERLVRLFASFGRHGYLSSEIVRERSVPVSYMIAPVFGPDGQPHYEIVVQLLRAAMRGAEIDAVGERLLATAGLLSDAIGGPRGGRAAGFR